MRNKYRRIDNFSAGPAMLPEEVLLQARDELLNWHGSGISVMEMSHRSSKFDQIAKDCIHSLRQLLDIPSNYHVLFLGGGARTQFSMVPMNLLKKISDKAQYIISGYWSESAAKEAEEFGNIRRLHIVKRSGKNVEIIPNHYYNLKEDNTYIHMTSNETIEGIQFFEPVLTKGTAHIIADMSSDLLSRQIDVRKYDLIYASAQKNMGIAGITYVIIKEGLLKPLIKKISSMLDYRIHIAHNSFFNTPPTYPLYVSNLYFNWMKDNGGVPLIEMRNKKKAQIIYEFIDDSDFYTNNIPLSHRSWMNIVFSLPTPALEKEFIEKAKKNNLIGLEGHRTVGGVRASIYNAIDTEILLRLISFMNRFAIEKNRR